MQKEYRFSNRLLVYYTRVHVGMWDTFSFKMVYKRFKVGPWAEPLCTKHFVLVRHSKWKIVIVLLVVHAMSVKY